MQCNNCIFLKAHLCKENTLPIAKFVEFIFSLSFTEHYGISRFGYYTHEWLISLVKGRWSKYVHNFPSLFLSKLQMYVFGLIILFLYFL